ncbi:SgcJ/EcaC family oxidoreductase [Pelagibius sp. CAU 1746]|uniref:YybH family protein n=1 Tax=Pelagibius sp. CAU 1746 TaxID=3140370 RepID=UPI00325B8A08
MADPMEVVKSMCARYQTAVSANDSTAYGKLFAEDAIRVPPGSEPEHGPEAIAQSEQKDYDVAKWSIQSKPLDALHINDDWVFGIAEAAVNTVPHDGGTERSFKATKTWLLQKQPSGEWLIKRQMWNLK